MHSSTFVSYIVVIQLILLFTQRTTCLLRVDSPLSFHLDRSGWRTIDVTPVANDDEEEIFGHDRNYKSKQLDSSIAPSSSTTPSPTTSKNKKLIEWDDDDHLMNDLNSLKDSSIVRLTPYEYKTDYKVPVESTKSANNHTTSNSNKPSRKSSRNNRYSKLIYHGQVRENGAMKVVEGIKMYINTQKATSISRRSSSRLHHWFAPEEVRDESTRSSLSGEEESKHSIKLSEENVDNNKNTNKDMGKDKKNIKMSLDKSPKYITELQSNSDWKPISSASRSRRMSKIQPTPHVVSTSRPKSARTTTPTTITTTTTSTPAPSTTTKPLKIKLTTQNDTQDKFKWRPVVKTKLEDRTDTLKPNSTKSTAHSKKGSVVYGKKTLDSPSHLTSSFEEPFDDDGLIVSRRIQFEESKQRESKSAMRGFKSAPTFKPQNYIDNRWTPVETTTIAATTTTLDKAASEQAVTTTTATLLGNGTNPETAQKSASDLNYIYSSQPVANQDWSNIRQASNSYYTNYVVQPVSQQQPVTQPQNAISQPIDAQGPIIDTISGQTPEMIMDRQPEQPNPSIDGYSIPQTNANFQPAQPPPMRLYGGYDTSNSYYSPNRQQAPQLNQQPQQQSKYVQTTLAPNVVRQEHHYHYYNNNNQQPQSPDRGQQIQQPQQLQQSQNVIREIQPLLISQPIIQQAPSTSTPPPPQIIREIIRETPAQLPIQIQPMQVSRIVLPQTILSPISQPNMRDFDQSVAPFNYAPPAPAAQRIVRQISSSLPSATIKMQSIPVRLPVPTIQFPIRLAPSNPAPVTRQTGSFVIPPIPKKTTTYLTETQAMPTHTTIMHTTQFTPATRTTVYTTDHQAPQTLAASTGYKK